ncbi:DUF1573 domain-containing protein [Capnocytophaga sp. ARDL2]|uniref:DUF1573 domain-containing protein n=1 Tax=Capnocytophaga sp. ARDL2 TaxID=3238809 RepID=UPI003557FF5B
MKKIVILVLALASFTACKKTEDASKKVNEITVDENATVSSEDLPIIEYDTDTHDFGDLKKGDKATHEFKISNTGKSDLVIINASASCGCTVPEKPTEPIKPGESASMKVEFSATAAGVQSKTVSVVSNASNSMTQLTVKANVTE